MSKVFTSKEFIEKLRWLVYDVPNVYHSENGTWCTLHNGKVWMDCVVSIKGLLWGFINDYSINNRGGAVYESNGVADFTTNGGLDHCTEVKSTFDNLVPGEYLCMAGTQYSHAGIYLGGGDVFECTTSWGANKCIISKIDDYGNRYLNGVKDVPWTRRGKLEYIDYNVQPEPLKYKVGDYVEINGVYVSSTSTEKLTPLIDHGTITLIVDGAPNPYLLDDGNIGWVNDSCIVEPEPPTPTDYEKLYKEEVEKNKLLQTEIDTLKEKIDKAIKDLS